MKLSDQCYMPVFQASPKYDRERHADPFAKLREYKMQIWVLSRVSMMKKDIA